MYTRVEGAMLAIKPPGLQRWQWSFLGPLIEEQGDDRSEREPRPRELAALAGFKARVSLSNNLIST
jgi:hypothetical protein